MSGAVGGAAEFEGEVVPVLYGQCGDRYIRAGVERTKKLGKRIWPVWQYYALLVANCTEAVHSARMEFVNQIAAVESPRMIMDATQARLRAKTIGDPTIIGDTFTRDVWH